MLSRFYPAVAWLAARVLETSLGRTNVLSDLELGLGLNLVLDFWCDCSRLDAYCSTLIKFELVCFEYLFDESSTQIEFGLSVRVNSG